MSAEDVKNIIGQLTEKRKTFIQEAKLRLINSSLAAKVRDDYLKRLDKLDRDCAISIRRCELDKANDTMLNFDVATCYSKVRDMETDIDNLFPKK